MGFSVRKIYIICTVASILMIPDKLAFIGPGSVQNQTYTNTESIGVAILLVDCVHLFPQSAVLASILNTLLGRGEFPLP